MDWNRAQLKEKAKAGINRNYWKCVLVALVLSMITGSGGNSGNNNSSRSSGQQKDSNVIEKLPELFKGDIDWVDLLEEKMQIDFPKELGSVDEDLFGEMEHPDLKEAVFNLKDVWSELDGNVTAALAGIAAVVIAVVAVALVLGILLDVFAFNPLEVGCYKFFVNNEEGSEVSLKDMGHGFRNGNYGNVVKIMFLKSLYNTLWYFLFIIPGIIKTYEYRMIPYILTDNPSMDPQEVFAKSKEMMDGQKWNAFVLDLSFLGWLLLSACTCGILAIFYVNPYIDATNAELYLALGGGRYTHTGSQGYQDYSAYQGYSDYQGWNG